MIKQLEIKIRNCFFLEYKLTNDLEEQEEENEEESMEDHAIR